MVGTGWRWALVLWADRALLVVLVAAVAAPSTLVSAAAVWESAAADVLAVTVVDSDPTADLGPTIGSEVRFDEPGLVAVDRLVRAALADIDRVGPATRTSYTLPALASVGGDRLGRPVRILGRQGAGDAIEVTAGDPTTGASISTFVAEEYGVAIGDEIEVESVEAGDLATNDVVPGGGTRGTFEVTAIYAPLWQPDDADPPPAWRDVAELVPRYLSPFDAPNFALVIVPEPMLWQSGMTGVVRWHAPADTPRSNRALGDLAQAYAVIETDLVRETEVGVAFRDLAGPVDGVPTLTSDLPALRRDLAGAIDRVSTPIRSARLIGLGLSIAVLAAAAAVYADRQQRDHRLLAGEGRRWPALTTIALLQVAGPAAIGTVLGALAGVAAANALGVGSGFEWATVPLGSIAVTGAVSTVLLSVIIGTRAQGALDRRDPIATRVQVGAAAAGIGGTAALWVAVGQDAAAADDLATVLAPIAVVTLAVSIGVSLLALAARTIGPPRDDAGVVVLLVRQRLQVAMQHLAAIVLGVGTGALLFSAATTAAIDQAVATRAATAVGSTSRLEVFGAIPAGPTPTGASLLRVLDSRVVPGDSRVRVVAVDPETFAAVVAWPDAFGSSATDALALLTADGRRDIAAVAIAGEGLPPEGAFGGRSQFPYSIVGEVRSLPLARSFGPTLLVSAPQVDAVAARTDVDVLRATARFRPVIISTDDAPIARRTLEAAGFGVRATESLAAVASTPAALATRFGLRYQRLLGIVMIAVSVAGLAMSLATRRRARQTAVVMLGSMGVSSSRLASATALETAITVAVATAAGAVGARLAEGRLLDALDPTPGATPAPLATLPLAASMALVVVAVALCSGGAWVADRVLARRSTTVMTDAA